MHPLEVDFCSHFLRFDTAWPCQFLFPLLLADHGYIWESADFHCLLLSLKLEVVHFLPYYFEQEERGKVLFSAIIMSILGTKSYLL